jgi:hypothetical protein
MSKELLREHVSETHERFKCQVTNCHYATEFARHLGAHVSRMHSKKLYKCDVDKCAFETDYKEGAHDFRKFYFLHGYVHYIL